METKIGQDSFLSGQLTLSDQREANVIRGNVPAIPIDDTLLYVESIYLQAETAARRHCDSSMTGRVNSISVVCNQRAPGRQP